jgi:NADPH:quinone reductase-like Zn-dependent oxidoreductase
MGRVAWGRLGSVFRMHAAVLHEYGTPRYDEFEEPVAGEGQVVVEVGAAGLNPVDVRKAAGIYFAGKPPLPGVAGTEGIGRVVGSGRRAYFDGTVAPFGSMADRALVEADALFDVPEALEDGVAVAIGIAGLAAWVPLAWRARLEPGETVLVLGGTGTVGQIAVQAAKLQGAGRVVAAGRDGAQLGRAIELGADAVVELGAHEDLAAAFREAAGGDVDVVLDPLWGEPAVAAIEALGVGGRFVQIGGSAGAEATLASGPVRGKVIEIRGYMHFLTPREVLRDGYRQLSEHAAAGRIAVDVERIALCDVAEAWERQQAPGHRKLVLVP